MRKLIISVVLILSAAAAIALSVARLPAAAPRVVAIGDIHGDLDDFATILKRAGLIDASQHWSGRNTILVQTGDVVDRGPKSRAALDLLIELQKEAPKQGGRVIALLGNHETMDMYGFLDYVTPADYASYADDKSERKRAAAYEAYAALGDSAPRSSQEEWIKRHPFGFVEFREAFGPNGKYGKWVRSLPAVAKVNDSLFLHGGISPDVASLKFEQINQRITSEFQAFDNFQKFMADQKIALPFFTFDEMTASAKAALNDPKNNDPDRRKLLEAFLGSSSWLSIHPTGPLWFRGYAEWTDSEGGPLIQHLKEAFGVAHFIVGHTPQAGQIAPRFGGSVYLIDTGMLSSYFPHGRASALEILDGKFTAIYPDGSQLLN